jgi:hypothetical protein
MNLQRLALLHLYTQVSRTLCLELFRKAKASKLILRIFICGLHCHPKTAFLLWKFGLAWLLSRWLSSVACVYHVGKTQAFARRSSSHLYSKYSQWTKWMSTKMEASTVCPILAFIRSRSSSHFHVDKMTI